MPAQPPNIQQTDNCIPRKCQAWLDDNGEPPGVPASKKAKWAEKNGPKKKVPTKKWTERKEVFTLPHVFRAESELSEDSPRTKFRLNSD